MTLGPCVIQPGGGGGTCAPMAMAVTSEFFRPFKHRNSLKIKIFKKSSLIFPSAFVQPFVVHVVTDADETNGGGTNDAANR